jgi:hypothetical protein
MAGQATRGSAAEERRRIQIGVFEIIRDRPGFGDPAVAVDNDRNQLLCRWRDLRLFGKAPGDRLERKPLVRQCHSRPPAIRAEAAVRLRAGEVIVTHRHVSERGFEGKCISQSLAIHRASTAAVWPKRIFFDSSLTVGAVLISLALA